jgi:hypothetical protein
MKVKAFLIILWQLYASTGVVRSRRDHNYFKNYGNENGIALRDQFEFVVPLQRKRF